LIGYIIEIFKYDDIKSTDS